MPQITKGLVALCAAAALGLAGCAHSQAEHHGKMDGDGLHFSQGAHRRAIAVMHATEGNTAHGVVLFEAMADGSVRVVAEIAGLNPGQQHAIHVHEFGDCTAGDGTTAGGHYNPEGHPHALVSADVRHAGDLGNLQADAQGATRYEVVVHNISINGHNNPVVGRGVIIHAKPDDGGQPTGNAGARIACGVIGLAKDAD